MALPRTTRRLLWIGVPVVLVAVLVAVWRWDWFIPMVDARASAAIGRTVTIEHLHLRIGRVVTVVADGVVIGNPPDWPQGDPPLAAIRSLTVQADALTYLRRRSLVIPLVDIDTPTIWAAETPSGAANFRLAAGAGGGTSVKIGDLRITDGNAHVVAPRLKADFNARIDTKGEGAGAQLVIDGKGTYAAQPITFRMVGGALLSLRDASHPWPVDITLANGPTRVALSGSVRDPLAFRGADIRLRLSGPDLGLLEHLVGLPIPATPAYQISGRVDLLGFNKIRITDFAGRVGNSDVRGTIEAQLSGTEAAGKEKPVVTMDLQSNRVDLADFAGVLGGVPGRPTTALATPQERRAAAEARASPKLLPDTPIAVPKLQWADIHLRYHGAHIEGRDMPLDDVAVTADVVGGRIMLHPLSFGVGKGRLVTNVDLTPVSNTEVHAKADVRMQNLDVSRLMAATHAFHGTGSVSGVGAIDATGNSVASLVGHGNGEVKMAMAGGSLSAVLVDLTGLQFGNALLSALGMPNQTPVQCFVADLELRRGLLDLKAMTLDTGEAIVNVDGDVDLTKEAIDLSLKTDSKHFSIGSLPTRIHIGGTFKDPSIRPGASAIARAGATAGLAVLFAPLAILPTIQFGTSEAEDARCTRLLQQARATAGGQALPAPKPATR